jgi:hypothetical protein
MDLMLPKSSQLKNLIISPQSLGEHKEKAEATVVTRRPIHVRFQQTKDTGGILGLFRDRALVYNRSWDWDLPQRRFAGSTAFSVF